MTKKKCPAPQTPQDCILDATSSSSNTGIDTSTTTQSSSVSTTELQAFNNIQFSRPEDQEIPDSSSSSEDTLLYPSHYISILQQIYDICDARIYCNKELAKYLMSCTTIQELKESNILSPKTLETGDIYYVLENKLQLSNNGVYADIKKYENIRKKTIELQSLIINVLEKKDISISSSPQAIQLELKLIEIYVSLIIQFWLNEEGGKKVDIFHKDFREYYYVNLIKQYWEQLLSMSFNIFHKEYCLFIPASYKSRGFIKLVDEPAHISFKTDKYQIFIDNLAEKCKNLIIKLNALQPKETEKFIKLTEILETEKTKIIGFFCGNTKLTNAIKELFAGKKIVIQTQTHTQTQTQVLNLKDILENTSNTLKKMTLKEDSKMEKILCSYEEQYLLYISCKYLQEILQQLNNELSLKKHDLPKNLIKKLQKLTIEEDSARKILNQQEDLASKKISTAIKQESFLIDHKAKLESQKSTEAIRRNNIEKEEQKSRESINIYFQSYLQKKANLEKQTKRPPKTQKEKVSSIEDKPKQIIDTRIFTIDPEIIIANFKLLENLIDNTDSLTFQQAQAIVSALGGIIKSNSGGGSHHKILFHERVRSCFDTIAPIVRPHGKEKQNEITGFALKAFKAAITRVLPNNWQMLLDTKLTPQ